MRNPYNYCRSSLSGLFGCEKDNMNRGYSHFYSEVRRVKEVAMKLKEKNRLLVIFDELFRGTNVKDAFDASLLIIT